MSTGEKVINLCIAQPLFKATCPDAPDSTCVVHWRANAADQIDALIAEKIQSDRETILLCKAIFEKHGFSDCTEVMRIINHSLST